MSDLLQLSIAETAYLPNQHLAWPHLSGSRQHETVNAQVNSKKCVHVPYFGKQPKETLSTIKVSIPQEILGTLCIQEAIL
jgi:hypothetical protein